MKTRTLDQEADPSISGKPARSYCVPESISNETISATFPRRLAESMSARDIALKKRACAMGMLASKITPSLPVIVIEDGDSFVINPEFIWAVVSAIPDDTARIGELEENQLSRIAHPALSRSELIFIDLIKTYGYGIAKRIAVMWGIDFFRVIELLTFCSQPS
jgi:hypothetical protein